MFAQKSINQQINNDIFINSTLMQIEKGIDLYINKFDINKDTSMTIQHDLMGLSINISFSAHHHYASAKCSLYFTATGSLESKLILPETTSK